MDHRRNGALFWVTAAVGGAIVLYGIAGLLQNEPRGASSATRWFVGGALTMDLLVIPIGATIAYLARRLVSPWAWPAVRAGLFISAVLVAVALPLVTDQGGVASNPTVRPRNYGQGLAWALVVTWLTTAVGVWVAARKRMAAQR